MFKRFQRVQLKANRDLIMPEGAIGRVAAFNGRRSTAGYDTLVVWRESLDSMRFRRSWVPSRYLKAI
jgi:hypothetical protein